MLRLRAEGKGPFAIAACLNRVGLSNPRTRRLWSPGGAVESLTEAFAILAERQEKR